MMVCISDECIIFLTDLRSSSSTMMENLLFLWYWGTLSCPAPSSSLVLVQSQLSRWICWQLPEPIMTQKRESCLIKVDEIWFLKILSNSLETYSIILWSHSCPYFRCRVCIQITRGELPRGLKFLHYNSSKEWNAWPFSSVSKSFMYSGLTLTLLALEEKI